MTKPAIRFTIDGRECRAKAGQTIYEAAKDNGIYIPTLCRYEGFKPAGSCRICTVRVGGRYMAACTQPVAEGMSVENKVPDLEDMRKSLIEMFFVEGNHMCPTCEKSGNCELQALAYRYQMLVPRFPYQFPKRDVEPAGTKILMEQNRCVKCLRCVRGVRDQGQPVRLRPPAALPQQEDLRRSGAGLGPERGGGPQGHGALPRRLDPQEGGRLRRAHRPAQVRQGPDRQRDREDRGVRP